MANHALQLVIGGLSDGVVLSDSHPRRFQQNQYFFTFLKTQTLAALRSDRHFQARFAIGQQDVDMLLDLIVVAGGDCAKPLVTGAGLQ